MGSWMGAVQIPFRELGGAPGDGQEWGIQAALRYADPKITAVLSPTDEFTDRSRFARLRFDMDRRANYRCHWLCADEIKGGTFVVGGIFSNGANEPEWFDGRVTLFKGDRTIGGGTFAHAAKPLATYDGDMQPARFASEPASAADRDTVGRLVVTDRRAKTIVYDQFIPYWRVAPGERDWLKRHFAKEFTFLAGPYPSFGKIDYRIDCQTLMEAIPGAARVIVTVASAGRQLVREELPLPKDGKLAGMLDAGTMRDGAKYDVAATIVRSDGQPISEKRDSFTRTVMLFEKAPKAGLEDLVPAPFTPPTIAPLAPRGRGVGGEGAIGCVGRTYAHGSKGLLMSLIAADQEMLAAPATLRVKIGDRPPIALEGDRPTIVPQGKGRVSYRQTFSGGGVKIDLDGIFDYDGFYRFSARLARDSETGAAAEHAASGGANGGGAPPGRSICGNATWKCRSARRVPRCSTRRSIGCPPAGAHARIFSTRRKAGCGIRSAIHLRPAIAKETCRRIAGSATMIAGFVIPVHRIKACTTTMPCPRQPSIVKVRRSCSGRGLSTSRSNLSGRASSNSRCKPARSNR